MVVVGNIVHDLTCFTIGSVISLVKFHSFFADIRVIPFFSYFWVLGLCKVKKLAYRANVMHCHPILKNTSHPSLAWRKPHPRLTWPKNIILANFRCHSYSYIQPQCFALNSTTVSLISSKTETMFKYMKNVTYMHILFIHSSQKYKRRYCTFSFSPGTQKLCSYCVVCLHFY